MTHISLKTNPKSQITRNACGPSPQSEIIGQIYDLTRVVLPLPSACSAGVRLSEGGGVSAHLLLLSDSCSRCVVILNNTVVFGSSEQTIPDLYVTSCTYNIS